MPPRKQQKRSAGADAPAETAAQPAAATKTNKGKGKATEVISAAPEEDAAPATTSGSSKEAEVEKTAMTAVERIAKMKELQGKMVSRAQLHAKLMDASSDNLHLHSIDQTAGRLE